METFEDYEFVARGTAIYPGAGTGSGEALAYLGLGLGEAGEVQGKIKKVLRDDGGVLTADARDAIAAELGDLLWYVSNLATEIGVPLGLIAGRNIAKLSSRAARGALQGSGDNR